ncbi:TnsA endonuclease N-terminal domain-containing protein [Psychrobacter sp. DAB_AL43B]|uniref:TnsA endonuclease N-terminal domain-containing protein n=1 Tax=Psychrobacter sp. DAB_AL43B TaxID=1028416 RepID=UPI0018D2C645|nr:TnsA endonuclease N-terminal domain-containing protein [Psychrobacter sp. DAB_AL43B]
MRQMRKIKPTRMSVSGRIPYKGKSLPYESTLERDLIIVHAFREDVEDIVAQPITIPFVKNGITYKYTPDFFIKFVEDDGKPNMIIEVKPYDLWQANWRDWSDKWKTMQRYCKDNGYVFHIYDESRIKNTALDNINLLMKFKNSAIEEEDKEAVLEQVRLMGTTTIDYLLTRFYIGSFLRNHGLRVIYHLLATKRLKFNLFLEINDLTEVWVDYE